MRRHFTATAFVIDSRQRALLIWHRRLKRWMPPGGHLDEDETPEDAAARECKEETGLDVRIEGGPQGDLFAENKLEGKMLKKPLALLLENIPESLERGEPAHQHIDFVYIARPLSEKQEIKLAAEEGSDIRWFDAKQIEKLNEQTEIFANVKQYILSALRSSGS